MFAGEPSGHRCDMMVVIYSTCDLILSILGNAMGNLAGTYGKLGRHQDALVMHEKALEFLQRVLPKNHPDIGTR